MFLSEKQCKYEVENDEIKVNSGLDCKKLVGFARITILVIYKKGTR